MNRQQATRLSAIIILTGIFGLGGSGVGDSGVANLALADEGMWLFNRPPRELLKSKYQFELTEEWLEHVQRSAVRFNSGGSASFVSGEGLVITNHHVGADALQKLSSDDKDYLKAGFLARTREAEIRCVDLELNVLISIEDVTERVNAAVKGIAAAEESQRARRAIMNTIEEESLTKTRLRSDVITLYQGGEYHLYRYQRYTDVRLVFAPEQDIAFFGGDPDNFEYPRYDLDICFFRVYENDKPLPVPHFLKWSVAGVQADELVFVAGNPGKTDRLNTVAHLEFLRDRVYPTSLNIVRRHEVLLSTYSLRSPENARRAQDELFGIQNDRKASGGGLLGLQDPALMQQKRTAEKEFWSKASQNSRLKLKGDPRQEIESALKAWSTIFTENSLLERGSAFNSQLFQIARMITRLVDETAKPNAERLREYRESNQASLEQELFSEAPLYDDLEIVKLGDSLSMFIEMAGADNPLVLKVLGGKSPAERAAELIEGTKLKSPEFRKQLVEGKRAALEAAHDPLLDLVQLVDPAARKVRKVYEAQVQEPLRQAYARISQARFAVYGGKEYPDATFTLRLAFGTVGGYTERGQELPAWTTLEGTYKHAELHENQEPYALPQSWLEAKDRLDLSTPFNFVSTPDIIGGNSGSPVINREGEFVGIIFDGNLESLVLDFAYTDKQARAISVDARAILETLKKIYQAEALVKELAGE